MSQRKLAAIMFTDIVGYTALMGADEDKAFKILHKNRQIQRHLIRKYNGVLLKEMGDGILANFHTASDAVRCACEIQQAVKNEDIPLRIGIHEGEVVFEGNDVLGDGVNIASRLEKLASIGRINISDAVYKNIKNKVDISSEFLEERKLKNVDEPIKIYAVNCEGIKDELVEAPHIIPGKSNIKYYLLAIFFIILLTVIVWKIMPNLNLSKEEISESNPPERTIAVLPLRNDSPEMDNEYICNGFMEDILTHLNNISGLRVKSRQTLELYRNSKKSIKTIGAELNVAYILEGSFRSNEDSIRVTLQLIETSTGDHLWANSYDGSFSTKIFEFQSDVAKQVDHSLNVIITSREEAQIDRIPTEDTRAYAYVKLGKEYIETYWKDLDTTHIYSALNLFNKALELDPNLVEALRSKGRAYGTIGMEAPKGRFRNYRYMIDSSLFYFKKVIEIDTLNQSAYTAIGETYQRIGNKEFALKYLKKAIELKPDDAWTHLQLGILYLESKEYEEAFSYFYKSLQLNWEELPGLYNNVGVNFLNTGCYEKAEENMKKALELQVGCAGITQYIRLLRLAGKYEKALHFIDSIKNTNNCGELYYRNLFRIHTALKNYEEAKDYIPGFNAYWITILKAYLDKEVGKNDFGEDFNRLENQLNELYAKDGRQYSSTLFLLAQINAIKGNNEAAVKYLLEYEKLRPIEYEELWYVRFDIIHADIEAHPIFEDLQDNPEFQGFVDRAKAKREAIEKIALEVEERYKF